MGYGKVYRKIKKYKKIVIVRHIGADPDALGSQLGLKASIKAKFPNKEVYAVGLPAASFKFIGTMDKFDESMYDKSLLIILDTPDKKRVDAIDPSRFEYSIKIDHHPNVESFCDIEIIDDSASSASQMVLELINKTPLPLTEEVAEKLFVGVIGDTERFLFNYTTPKTFRLIAKLIQKTKINFTNLYNQLYLRPVKEVRFKGFIADNMIVTENGFGYLKIDIEIMKKYNVDAATAGNMVNDFGYINEVIAWAIFSEDTVHENIRGSIRSRGPVINEVVSHFGGGGHKFASGVRLKTFEDADELITVLDNVCKDYKAE